jgi:hypothetical protein
MVGSVRTTTPGMKLGLVPHFRTAATNRSLMAIPLFSTGSSARLAEETGEAAIRPRHIITDQSYLTPIVDLALARESLRMSFMNPKDVRPQTTL